MMMLSKEKTMERALTNKLHSTGTVNRASTINMLNICFITRNKTTLEMNQSNRHIADEEQTGRLKGLIKGNNIKHKNDQQQNY